MHRQVVVLGGGPGGYAAAFLAADKGLAVTLVEAEPRLGGTCLVRGCIPSKALLHVARVMSEVAELRDDWGVDYGEPKLEIEKLRARKDKLISTLSGGLAQLAKRRKVDVIQARGTFVNSTTIRLEGDHASIPDDRTLTFDHAILATGSVPAMPSAFRIGSDRVMDSAGALSLADIPATLLVVGGGYIGLELGTVYAHFGSKVTVVELMDGLLPGADRDLVKPLHRRLDRIFEKRIHLNTRVASLTDVGGSVEATLEGPEKQGAERFDRVLVSVGRRPNTQRIGLETTGVKLDERGFVSCNHQQATDDPHIWAIGDAAGEPMLAHKAVHEGRAAVAGILGEPAGVERRVIPAVVFTDPEIAWAGLTEMEAKRENREVSIEVYPWGASGRAHALGRTDGLTKWLIDPATGRIVGCGITGPGAGELIAEGVLAIEKGCTVREIADIVHPHPTLSETLMNAAEVYFGTATEIYKPKR